MYAARASRRPWFSAQKNHTQKTVAVPRKSSRPKQTVRRPATKTNPTGTQIAQQAIQYYGAPYRYGGTSKTKGLDCSGLVVRVWSDLQLKKVPRASRDLYNSGKPVRLAELKEGDLVFFKNTYKKGISHVGVYAGSNKFIHAPGDRKRVSITRLSDPYYQLHYAGARRLY